MQFEFSTATRIVLSRIRATLSHRKQLGPARRASRGQVAEAVRTIPTLDRSAPDHVSLSPSRTNRPPHVRQGTELARSENCDLAVAAGGSVLMRWAISILLTNGGDVRLHRGGRPGKTLRNLRARIALPTTAGTGAEVTQCGVGVSGDA